MKKTIFIVLPFRAKEKNLWAIEKDSICAINNLAEYYDDIGDYEQMKKYYLMAIDKGSTYAMYYMAKYYKSIEENYELMKHYYLMGINHDDNGCMRGLEEYYKTNKHEFYKMLLAIENKSYLINQKLNELKNSCQINIFINKVNLMTKLNNIHECFICYETKLNIPLNCFHEVCVDCYYKLTKCALCNV